MTYLDDIEIVRANPDELENVFELWLEAANWLESMGIRQWKPNSFTIDSVKEHFNKTDIHCKIKQRNNSYLFITMER